jgi:hypothetical protein
MTNHDPQNTTHKTEDLGRSKSNIGKSKHLADLGAGVNLN